MDLKSISGYTCFVADLAATEAFYKQFGFRMGDKTERTLRIYLNWFAIDFVWSDGTEGTIYEKDALSKSKGDGVFFNVKVGDVDAAYKDVVSWGLKPSSEPSDMPWGTREFVLRDPDGYKLLFWNKA